MDNNRVQLSGNCGVCGDERIVSELKPVKLGRIGWNLSLCPVCFEKDTATNYKEAAEILKK